MRTLRPTRSRIRSTITSPAPAASFLPRQPALRVVERTSTWCWAARENRWIATAAAKSPIRSISHAFRGCGRGRPVDIRVEWRAHRERQVAGLIKRKTHVNPCSLIPIRDSDAEANSVSERLMRRTQGLGRRIADGVSRPDPSASGVAKLSAFSKARPLDPAQSSHVAASQVDDAPPLSAYRDR